MRRPSDLVRAVRPLVAAAVAVAVGLGLSGCDDDGSDAAPTRPARPAVNVNPSSPGGANNKAQLAERVHIEDRVSCATPDKPSDAKDGACDPKAPSCDEHSYCLQLAQGYYCEPCPGRDRVRHAFKDRDFVGEQNRDPFQSYFLPQLTVGKQPDVVPLDPTKKCLRDDQMVATTLSYLELKLVGIVVQGTQRKVLMMGGSLGYVLKRGDCVGKEKAVVKDIGTGYITFLVDPDPSAAIQRAPEEYSVQLNPKPLVVNDPGLPAPRTTPVVPPPAVVLPGVGSAGSGAVVMPPVESPPGAPRKL